MLSLFPGIGLLPKMLTNRRPGRVQFAGDSINREPARTKVGNPPRRNVCSPIVNKAAPTIIIIAVTLSTHPTIIVRVGITAREIGPVVSPPPVSGAANVAPHRRTADLINAQVEGLVRGGVPLPVWRLLAGLRIAPYGRSSLDAVMAHESPHNLLAQIQCGGDFRLRHISQIQFPHRRYNIRIVGLWSARLPRVYAFGHDRNITRQCHGRKRDRCPI